MTPRRFAPGDRVVTARRGAGTVTLVDERHAEPHWIDVTWDLGLPTTVDDPYSGRVVWEASQQDIETALAGLSLEDPNTR